MGTLENENYLRHVWLLVEGGLLVLRLIVLREAATTGRTLETRLQNRRASFHNIIKEQRERLFPSDTKVNDDVNTWDISLLLVVLKRMLWSNLTVFDKASIKILKTYRDDFQAHPTTVSMSSSDYGINRQLLEQALRHLSSGVNANVEIEDIISKTTSGSIDIQSVFQYMKEIDDLKTSVLCVIEEKLQQIDPKLSLVENTTIRIEEKVDRLSREITHLAQMIFQIRIQESKRELLTIMEAECENEQKQKKAIDVIFDFIKLIRNESSFTEEEIREIIRKRIEWYGYVSLDLIDDVMKWFGDISRIPDVITGYPGTGSIRIPLFCSSVTGLLNLLTYINGDECRQRLSSISSTVSGLLSYSCSLSWNLKSSDPQNTMSSFLEINDTDEPKSSGNEKEKRKRKMPSSGSSEDPNTGKEKGSKIGNISTCKGVNHISTKSIPMRVDRMVVIPNKRIIAINYKKRELFYLDISSNNVDSTKLHDLPKDVCYRGEDKAVVCFDEMSVAIVDTTKKVIVKTLEGINRCIAVACRGNTIYVVDNKGCVHICDTMTEFFRKLIISEFEYGRYDRPRQITVSTDGSMIYLCNKSELFTVDCKGNIIAKIEINHRSKDICVIEDGTILSCARNMQDILQIDKKGVKILNRVKLPEDLRRTSAMCYDKANSCLIIANESCQIHVFEFH